ncbi:MAG: hypothetical protein JST93_26295 [Acidobacteria bacterium]|nr:hypothetical protein [Acidobacteriota bacterium]
MPHLSRLSPPVEGISEYINIDAKVGRDCANRSGDVEIIQRLVAIIARNSDMGIPFPTGRFDAITGYYIFAIQLSARRNLPGTVIDGAISPVPAGQLHYRSHGTYCLLHINAIAQETNPAAYAELISRFQRQSTPSAPTTTGLCTANRY